MSWQVDPNHSQINFSAKHMGIFTVRGQFKNFDIDFHFDEEHPENTSLAVNIDAASIDTHNDQRDGHLRSQDFLKAEEYPQLVFKSTRVEQIDENNGRLYGELTIRDVTREVVIDVVKGPSALSPWGQLSTGFAASTRIDRTEWGLTWNQALETGGVLVGNDISIEIELEAIKQAEQVPA